MVDELNQIVAKLAVGILGTIRFIMANPARTNLSSVLSERIGVRYWMPISLKIAIRFARLPTNGSRSKTKNAPMGHWESYRPDSIDSKQKTLHLRCLLDGGDYKLPRLLPRSVG